MSDIDIQPEDQAVFERLKSTGRITRGLQRVMTQQWNQCDGCRVQIPNLRPAFAGYTNEDLPRLVGACCAIHLSELATPVYWTGTLNLSVSDSQPTWRYMDFSKFVAMLQQGGLYFSRADQFDDVFEGATGLASRQSDWDKFYLDFFRKIVETPPIDVQKQLLSPERIEIEAQRLLKSIKAVSLESRNLLLNCWHANTGESEALWRLYSPPPTVGVAIKTTAGRLWEATSQESSSIVGRVHYLDYQRSFATIQKERIFCKRKSLSHENEIRIVLNNDGKQSALGKLLPCDLSRLIENVVVSPFAPSWCEVVVASVIEQYNYKFEVKRSEILEAPFY
jgi:hypothetical protein